MVGPTTCEASLRYLISMNIFKTLGQRSPNELLKFLNETPRIVNLKVPEKSLIPFHGVAIHAGNKTSLKNTLYRNGNIQISLCLKRHFEEKVSCEGRKKLLVLFSM